MDIYNDAMLNVSDAARYLNMPESTLRTWRKEGMIHSVESDRHGWPTLPFAAFVEAMVLRKLRELKFSKKHIIESIKGVRAAFQDEWALARPDIVHDGTDIFLKLGPSLYRAKDQQQAIHETISRIDQVVTWAGADPQRVRLGGDESLVILDPRFGWGRPVVSTSKTPVWAIRDLLAAGESQKVVADEFGLDDAELAGVIQWISSTAAA